MLDNETMKYLAGTAIAALGTAVGWVRRDTNARIKRVEEEVKTKASEAEVSRQRDHVVELFREVAAVRKDMNGGFEAIRKDMHAAHVDLIGRLPRA
jgi:flavoprotein